MPIALIAAAGIAAAGGIASSAIGAGAAGDAASAQANAAVQAAQISATQANKGLNFQTSVYNAGQQNLAPWLSMGRSANVNLANLLGLPVSGTYDPTTPHIDPNSMNLNLDGRGNPLPGPSMTTMGGPGGWNGSSWTGNPGDRVPLSNMRYAGPNGINYPGPIPNSPGGLGTGSQGVPLSSLINPSLGAPGSLSTPFTGKFVAPTDVTEQNDPGYKFRLGEGMKALQNSAAARGNLLTGATLKDINDYSQNFASNEYQNVYNRSLGEFQQGYNIFENNQAKLFNRLASMSGMGQVTANNLNSFGQGASNGVNNILLGSGNQIGSDLQNAGAARASGYVGAGNAWGQGITNLSSLAMLPFLSKYGGGPGSSFTSLADANSGQASG